MKDLISSVMPAYGVGFGQCEVRAYNRCGALTIGQAGVLDLGMTQAETTNFIQGDPASVWANVCVLDALGPDPANTSMQDMFAIPLIVKAAAADNTIANWWVFGTNISGEVDVTVDANVSQNVGIGTLATATLVSPVPVTAGAPTRKIVGVIEDPAGVAIALQNFIVFSGFRRIG